MNINILIGVVGVISGILCAQVDVSPACSGNQNDAADAKTVGRISE